MKSSQILTKYLNPRWGLKSFVRRPSCDCNFSRALAEQKISCNVIAGYNHDHICVEYNNKEKAFKILNELKL